VLANMHSEHVCWIEQLALTELEVCLGAGCMTTCMLVQWLRVADGLLVAACASEGCPPFLFASCLSSISICIELSLNPDKPYSALCMFDLDGAQARPILLCCVPPPPLSTPAGYEDNSLVDE